MKPKTALQKQVAKLSATLRPITATQEKWAYSHCVGHFAYRTKSGAMTCSDCGHVWKSTDSSLCDTVLGCKCPHCGTELKVNNTLKRKDEQMQYFSIITTHKGFQVIRVAQIKAVSHKGEPRKVYCTEVVQRWISPKGKVTDMALLRGMSFNYCDCWSYWSNMEVRTYNRLYDEVCTWGEVYPKVSVIPQIKRNGFKGDFYGISPFRLFKALLADPRMETLMKAGEIRELKHFITHTENADEFWASYLIAKRHRYNIINIGMWCDYLRMLKNLGKDIRNPKNICPEDFIGAHDRLTHKIEEKRRREWELADRKRDEERLLREKKKEEQFKTLKSKFFGLVISDNEISVKVLESIEEYFQEGNAQHICVFSSSYYLKKDTLVLSARIGDTIIETVEVDLQTLKVVQCHGKYNKDTQYHDRIINLVNSNARLIRERITA